MSKPLLNIHHPKRIPWYEFRKRSTPALFPLAYYFRPYTLPRRGRRHIDATFQVSFDHLDRQTLMDEVSYRKAQRSLLSRVDRKPTLIATQRRRGQRIATEWLAWCRHALAPAQLHPLTNAELVARYERYRRFYEAYSEENIYYWVIAADAVLDLCRRELAASFTSPERNHAFEVLTTPSEPSYLQRESDAFARIVPAAVIRGTRWLHRALERHSRHFGWVAWDYAGPQFWTAAKLARRLRRLTPSAANHMLQNELMRRRKLRAAQRKLEPRLTPHVRQLFSAAREQAMLQDDKKAVTTESHYWLHFLHAEVARRLHTNRRDLYFFTFDEIADALLHGVRLPDGLGRSAAGVVLTQQGYIQVASGLLARQWRKTFRRVALHSTSSLRGVVASRGLCRGRVALVLTQEDARKVKRGDILVTQMTTPEFIHAMERAAAFVTDEGGLTSHAAIVAREMQKPCVIGTKVATKVLKDGDHVEVDATKGIVRRLS